MKHKKRKIYTRKICCCWSKFCIQFDCRILNFVGDFFVVVIVLICFVIIHYVHVRWAVTLVIYLIQFHLCIYGIILFLFHFISILLTVGCWLLLCSPHINSRGGKTAKRLFINMYTCECACVCVYMYVFFFKLWLQNVCG